MASKSYRFLKFYFLTTQHVGSQLPAQGWNLCPLHWKHNLNHCTTREVPKATYFKRQLKEMGNLRSKQSGSNIVTIFKMGHLGQVIAKKKKKKGAENITAITC